jgi:hypothetical protein
LIQINSLAFEEQTVSVMPVMRCRILKSQITLRPSAVGRPPLLIDVIMLDGALAIALGAVSAALVADLLGRMPWHDVRLVLLIASMLVALYALFLDDDQLIVLTLGALVALYVPFVVIG